MDIVCVCVCVVQELQTDLWSTFLPAFGDAVFDGLVHQRLVGRHLGGGEDERRVGGGILRLVLLDGCRTEQTI